MTFKSIPRTEIRFWLTNHCLLGKVSIGKHNLLHNLFGQVEQTNFRRRYKFLNKNLFRFTFMSVLHYTFPFFGYFFVWLLSSAWAWKYISSINKPIVNNSSQFIQYIVRYVTLRYVISCLLSVYFFPLPYQLIIFERMNTRF